MKDSYHCNTCGADKPTKDFPDLSWLQDQYLIEPNECTDCRSDRIEAENKRTRARTRFHNNRCRAKALGVANTLTRKEWDAILDDTNGHCYYCGTYVGRENLEMEHVIPISKGGGNSADNVVAACTFCNRSKGFARSKPRILPPSIGAH